VGEAYFEAMGHPVALAVDPASGIIYLGFQDTSVRWAAVADVLERTFKFSKSQTVSTFKYTIISYQM
jgi:hypothetical protein